MRLKRLKNLGINTNIWFITWMMKLLLLFLNSLLRFIQENEKNHHIDSTSYKFDWYRLKDDEAGNNKIGMKKFSGKIFLKHKHNSILIQAGDNTGIKFGRRFSREHHIRTFQLGVLGGGGTASPRCKSPPPPLFCYISLLDTLIWNNFFVEDSF